METVLGAQSLNQLGGTESYMLTLAHELQRLGHGVTLTADELGPVAELAESGGIPVAASPSELPRTCDAVLTHDAVVTGRLAERYPGATTVHFAHSDRFDHQLPFPLPGVVSTVVALSDRVAARVRALALSVRLVRLRHPIDTERFYDAGPLTARPRRALLLSNYLAGDRRRVLVEAWEAAGVECTQVGAPTRRQLDVVPAISDADIVVGKARAALEGMSCARAVYVYDAYGGDGWVTPESYPAFEADNFAGLANDEPRTPRALAADLDAYRPEMGWTNRELVRRHHGARRHAVEVVEVIRESDSRTVGEANAAGEIARLVRLNSYAERQRLAAQRQAAMARERAREDRRQAAQARYVLGRPHVRAALAAERTLSRLRRVARHLGPAALLKRLRRRA